MEKWIKQNTSALCGKTVAVTGSTGGLGRALCLHLAALGANLILVDRNAARSEAFRDEMRQTYPKISVRCINADLESLSSVAHATTLLQNEPLDVFIHNAGAYAIPRRITESGFDNVFQINFVAPYYMIKHLLPTLRKRGGRVVAVGSIAHNYSKVDRACIDFRNRRQASRVYGNAKRYLTYSLLELFRHERDATLAITHPGIAFTNITAHYPKLIFALIKHPMKVIFMKPKKACLSILKGVFDACGESEWIGPRLFDVWGYPRKKPLRTASATERDFIFTTAERIFSEIHT